MAAKNRDGVRVSENELLSVAKRVCSEPKNVQLYQKGRQLTPVALVIKNVSKYVMIYRYKSEKQMKKTQLSAKIPSMSSKSRDDLHEISRKID